MSKSLQHIGNRYGTRLGAIPDDDAIRDEGMHRGVAMGDIIVGEPILRNDAAIEVTREAIIDMLGDGEIQGD